ncbi:MAG: hypothetical protein HKN04_14775 [Rhodothermaceae bacterium]|nr:hypothetical protein [Rhodothermaceae bacterium]
MQPRLFLALGLLVLASPAFAQPIVITGPGDETLDMTMVESGSQTFTMTVIQGEAQQSVGNGESSVTIDEERGVIEAVRSMDVMGQKMADTTRAAWPSLAALAHRSENMQRTLAFDIADGQLVGEHRPQSGEAASFEMALDAPVFDSAWMGMLIETLPLADGYAATIPAYEYEEGTMNAFTYSVDVLGQEKLTREGQAPTDAWLVQVSRDSEGGEVVNYYLAKDSHDILRIMLEPQPGLTVLVDFTNV